MAIVEQTVNIPLAEGFPMPSYMYDRSDYHLQTRTYMDDTWTSADGIVLYFRGSGASGWPDSNSPLVQEILGKNYILVTLASFGVAGASEAAPYRYGYGNVNAPHFTAHWIRTAWEVASVLASVGVQSLPCVILGHSRGASAALAWAAGYCGEDTPDPTSFSGLKGIVANGATTAGIGGYRWNDMPRNINSMCNLLALNKIKTLACWGGADDLAPPDYVKRIQQAIPEGKDTYVLTPSPDFGHSWIGSAAGAPILAQWIEQMMTDSPITLSDGVTPAVAGPVEDAEE